MGKSTKATPAAASTATDTAAELQTESEMQAEAEAPAQAEPEASTRLPLVELVASVRGFYRGSMVEPGKAFMFDPNPTVEGGKVKWPKWAAPRGQEAEKKPVVIPEAFDTRPAAAVKASKAKAGALGNV